jgi:hypothetical protein
MADTVDELRRYAMIAVNLVNANEKPLDGLSLRAHKRAIIHEGMIDRIRGQRRGDSPAGNAIPSGQGRGAEMRPVSLGQLVQAGLSHSRASPRPCS